MSEKKTDHWTELHTAAKNGDTETLSRLIHNGANLDAVTRLDWTPLHFAAKYGHLDCCQLLIEAGASTFVPAKLRFFTPFHIAALEGWTDIVRLFLEHGADINARTAEGWTPLHAAVEHAHRETVRFLLQRGADPNLAKRAALATFPLHSAARNGRRDIVQLLLDHGADPDILNRPNYYNKHGMTPRDLAEELGFQHLLEIFDNAMQPDAVAERKRIAAMRPPIQAPVKSEKTKIDRGDILTHIRNGDLEWIKQHRSLLDTVHHKQGITPLFEAVIDRQVDIVRYLLESGADPNPYMDGCRRGPLDFLLTQPGYDEPEIFRLLLEHGGDPNNRDFSGQTTFQRMETNLPSISLEILDLLEAHGAVLDPDWKKTVALRYAVKTQNHVQAEQLLEAGADPNRTYQRDMELPIIVALMDGDNEMLRILLRHGTVYTEMGPEDNSPLYFAAGMGNLEAVKILVESGMDVSKASACGSPLQAALSGDRKEIADYLIQRGATIEKRPKRVDGPRSASNPLPIFGAMSKGDSKLIRRLIDQGADIHAVGVSGRTLLHVAAEEGRTQWVKYLLDHGLNIDVEDSHGYRPLHQAAIRNKKEVVQYLLNRGASTDPPPGNTSPAIYAIMLGRVDLLATALENDPGEVNRRPGPYSYGTWAQLPILVALTLGNREMVELLVKHGAWLTASENVYHEGAWGHSALTYASETVMKDMLELFLMQDVNVNSKSAPRPALHCAASVEIAQILLDHGANPYLRSNEHRTALECQIRNKDVADLLRNVMSRKQPAKKSEL